MAVFVELDVMLARRKMSVGDFANDVGITPANIAVLKNGRAPSNPLAPDVGGRSPKGSRGLTSTHRLGHPHCRAGKKPRGL